MQNENHETYLFSSISITIPLFRKKITIKLVDDLRKIIKCIKLLFERQLDFFKVRKKQESNEERERVSRCYFGQDCRFIQDLRARESDGPVLINILLRHSLVLWRRVTSASHGLRVARPLAIWSVDYVEIISTSQSQAFSRPTNDSRSFEFQPPRHQETDHTFTTVAFEVIDMHERFLATNYTKTDISFNEILCEDKIY